MLSGIVFVNRNGLRWWDATGDYSPAKTLTNRWKRRGEADDFLLIMRGLAAGGANPRTVVIDATDLRAHRTATSLTVRKRGLTDRSAAPNGGMNTKLHAVADANGRLLSFFLTAGPVIDDTGEEALLDDLPKEQWLLGDRGYDAELSQPSSLLTLSYGVRAIGIR